MILELAIALTLGILAGTLSGISPGIHINLVSASLLASLSYFAGVPVLALVVFIVSMAITHTFIDFIPSIFLGAPQDDNYLAVLPGHQLLKEGKGHEAVVITLYGSLIAIPIILLASIIFIKFLPTIFEPMRILIPYILIFVSLYLIFREEEFLISLTVFILAGFLGLLTFNLPVKEPLLPMLTGLFGTSALIVSLKDKPQIPKQEIPKLNKIKLERSSFLKSTFAAALAAPACSFLPGIGSGHAAVLGSEIAGNLGDDKRSFLFLVGAINTIVMALSFVTAYSIQKTRTGAAAAVQELLTKINSTDLVLILFTVIISSILAFAIGIFLSKLFAKYISKINYSKISLFTIAILIIVNLVLSNIYGLLVLITATALGIFAVLSNSRRINLMGCLLIPTIVYYLAG
jgi:putative membrane protein